MSANFPSVCVLSYERPAFLEKCLTSLLFKSGKTFELIVHDDGSTDEAVHEILIGLWRVGMISKLILNPPGHNEGVGAAINRCFSVAGGELLFKVDQDLVFENGWLASACEILRDQSVGLTGLFAYHHDPVDVHKTGLRDGRLPANAKWSYHSHICGSAFGVRRSIYEKLGIAEHADDFSEDLDLMRRLRDCGYVCALPHADLCKNHGFGIPHSTVVTRPGETRSIHHGPMLLGPEAGKFLQ